MKSKQILAISILLPFFYILFYVWSTSADIVFRDDMYLIKGSVVEKLCDGTLAFSDLWRAAAKTRLLGYNLLLVANTAWFGLNSRLIVLLIPFFLLATALLIYRDYRRSFTGLRSPAFIAGTYALPMLLLFNVTLWEGLSFDFAIIFVWSVPWFVASFYALENLLRNGGGMSWLPAITVPPLAVLVFGQTASFPFGAALAVTLVCYLMLNRRSLPRGFMIRLLAIGAVLALLAFLYMHRINDNDYFPGSHYADWRVVMRVGHVLSFMLATLAASVVGVDAANAHLSFAAILLVGAGVALTYASSLIFYFRTRMYHRTYLPLFLIAYALAFVTFMMIGRLEYGVRYGMASRYTCNTICGIIAIVWIALFVLAGPARITTSGKVPIYAALSLIFAGLFWSADVEWRIQPDRKLSFRRLQQIALRLESARNAELADFEERPYLVRDSLAVLRKYKLGVYRLSAPPLVSTVKLALPAGAAGSTSTSSGQGSVQVGYATVDCDGVAESPYGTAVYTLVQNGDIISETAVPASSPSLDFRVYVEQHSDAPGGALDSRPVTVSTGIAVVNQSNALARVSYTLRDMEGVALTRGQGTIAPGMHFAKLIHQLAEVAPDFRLPANFASGVRFGSLEISSDQRVSTVAMRLTTNERNEGLITATPLRDHLNGAPSGNVVYIPQFVDGGGYNTSLILLNTSDRPETGIFHILDDNGNALPVSRIDGTSGSSFRYSIRPGGVFRFLTDGSRTAAKAGWVQMIADQNTSVPRGMGMFSRRQGGILVTESVVSPAVPTTHARIYVDKSFGHDTGVAIANPSTTSMTIALTAFRTDGKTRVDRGEALVGLPGHGHSAKFTAELIPGLPDGFTGILDISSKTPFVALALKSLTSARNDLLVTAFPIADLTRWPPSPMLFPHIVDGGGYTTELILLSAGPPVTATLKFLGETGLPLPIAK